MLQDILDSSHTGILQGEPGVALMLLYAGLAEAQRWDVRGEWPRLIDEVCLPHPLTQLIRQDPCLGQHPCSAAGGDINAFLESLLYRIPVKNADTLTPLGRRLFSYTANARRPTRACRGCRPPACR
jgi:hypothetical protein